MPESEPLEFIPLHFGDKLRIVNPRARLGVITLWSRIDFIEGKLREAGVDLDPATSKIAVIGNLYGNGLPHLLRNLLYNPQLRDIVVCGTNRSGSAEQISCFFENGLEEVDDLGEIVTRVAGTNRTIDALVTPEHFSEKLRIANVGDLRGESSRAALRSFIDSFDAGAPAGLSRVKIDLPEVHISNFPSDVRSHSIARATPLEAWRELIFRLVRFGRLVHLRKGDRQELLNVRVVVYYPREDSEEDLRKYGFSLEDIRAYQDDMLAAELPEDQPYTYGNRIRAYFGFDATEKFAQRLKDNPEDRDCYLALWDSRSDIDADDAPCLVSIFLRVHRNRLNLTAAYRTHNALDAWLKNVYGLMKLQAIVAEKIGMDVGPLSVISHSISIDPSKYDVAQRVANAKGFSLEFDPHGEFTIGIDQGEIVARHMDDRGTVLHEYRSKKAERIQHEINRDCAVSDVNHAMYIGRQLARAEQCLRTGEPFEEG